MRKLNNLSVLFASLLATIGLFSVDSVAQTTRVSPVTTFTCGANNFANILAATGAFSCGTSSVTIGSTSISLGATASTVSGLTLSGGTLSGTTTLTGMTPGSVLFAGAASALSQDNANLFWDDSNNRLGVGIAAPTKVLDVNGDAVLNAGGAGVRPTRTNIFGSGDSGTTGGYRASMAFVPVGASGFTTAVVFSSRASDVFNSTYLERARIHSDGNFGIGDFSVNAPQAKLHIGSTAPGTARTYNTFTDASNGEWAYLGDWGASANVATFGTAKNGTGTARNVSFVRDSTAYLQLVAAGSQFTGLVGIGQVPAAQLDIGGNVSAAAWTTNGIGIRARDATYTDTTSSGGPLANVYIHRIGVPTIAASSAITYTAATTLNINGPPIAGTNVTITTPYSLRVATGNSLFGGTLSATAFLVGAVAGVSCSGTPTAGFTSVNGIVTAC